MGRRGIYWGKKIEAVEKYKRGEGSQLEICKRYQIRSKKQLQDWITNYNGHKELRATKVREIERGWD